MSEVKDRYTRKSHFLLLCTSYISSNLKSHRASEPNFPTSAPRRSLKPESTGSNFSTCLPYKRPKDLIVWKWARLAPKKNCPLVMALTKCTWRLPASFCSRISWWYETAQMKAWLFAVRYCIRPLLMTDKSSFFHEFRRPITSRLTTEFPRNLA